MIRIPLIAVLASMLSPSWGQWGHDEEYFDEGEETQHFISLTYGEGRTDWYSRTEGYDLFDRQGQKVLSGDHRLTAVTDHQSYGIDVVAPVGRFRIGMGIEFDEFSLNRLYVEDSRVSRPIAMIDRFRFDKLHLSLEYPTRWIKNPIISFDLKLKAGYYAFSEVNSFSLFGTRRSGNTYFANLGFLFDVDVYKKTHLFFYPRIGYRHFDNNNVPPPGAIYHELMSYGLLGGLRYRLL